MLAKLNQCLCPILFGLLSCFGFVAQASSIPSVSLSIKGPKLTIEQLWQQVEERTPYKIDIQVPDPKQEPLHIEGINRLSYLVKATQNYYKKQYGINLATELRQGQLKFYKTDKKLVAKTPRVKRRSSRPVPYNERTTLVEVADGNEIDDDFSMLADPAPTPRPAVAENIVRPSLGDLETKTEISRAARPSLPIQPARTAPMIAESKDYRLKPGDQIEISVWGEDEMSRVIVIRPDGKISYLLVGEIAVVGLTFEELKKELEKRLSKYINQPIVSIIGKSFEGNFVSILGAVKSPGRKVVTKNDRVLDVLAKANGLRFEDFGGRGGEVANLQKAYLSRNGHLLKVNFSDLIYKGDMSQNLPVEIGDFIYIPSSIGAPIFITGEVDNPTSMPFRGQPTLLEAITEAGGFNTKAKKKEIYLVRGGLKKPIVTKVDYREVVSGQYKNVYLQPGDIIHVPPTTVTKIERLSAQILPFLNAIISTGSAEDTLKGRTQLK